MAKVVKVIEVLGQSEESWEAAAQGVVNEACKTMRNKPSIYAKEFEGSVENARIPQFRINAKVTFDLESERT